MFDKKAEIAKSLSLESGVKKYLFSYTIKINVRKSTVVEGKSIDEAKREFEFKFPTAKIINTLELS